MLYSPGVLLAGWLMASPVKQSPAVKERLTIYRGKADFDS